MRTQRFPIILSDPAAVARAWFASALMVGVPAQTVVSPSTCEKHEGEASSAEPFSGPGACRYQQVHTEFRATFRFYNAISWRRDGELPAAAGYGSRVVDMELIVCIADQPSFGPVFANNYSNTPSTVVSRKLVNAPDHTKLPPAVPAPWDFELPFDATIGILNWNDLLYEVAVWSSSAQGLYPLDAVQAPTTLIGGFTSVDLGCTTGTGVMELRSRIVAAAATNTLTLAWAIQSGPPSTAAAVLVGLTDPNVVVAGLCGSGRLHTDAALMTLNGVTNSSGAMATTPIVLAYDLRFPNFTLTAQAAAADPTKTPLPVAISNGIASALPPLPGTVATKRLYAAGSPTATSGTLTLASGLVTRFR